VICLRSPNKKQFHLHPWIALHADQFEMERIIYFNSPVFIFILINPAGPAPAFLGRNCFQPLH
jgi:hypothetical protein